MGDLPGAGAYWFVTERDDADAKAAAEALVERHSSKPDALLRFLEPRSRTTRCAPRQGSVLSPANATASGASRRSMQPARNLAGIEGRTTDRERKARTRITTGVAIALLVPGTVGVLVAAAAFLNSLVVRAVLRPRPAETTARAAEALARV